MFVDSGVSPDVACGRFPAVFAASARLEQYVGIGTAPDVELTVSLGREGVTGESHWLID